MITNDMITQALTPTMHAANARRAAAEALAVIADRLLYLSQLVEVSAEYGIYLPLDRAMLQAPTMTVLDLAEQVQAADQLLVKERSI